MVRVCGAAHRPCRPPSRYVAPRARRASGSTLRGHVPRVEPGDEERGHELQQPEDQRHVDVADDLGAHEVVGPVRHHDVEQVPGQEGDGRGEDEAAVALLQLPELGCRVQPVVDRVVPFGLLVGLDVVVVSAMVSPFRWSGERTGVTPFTLAEPVPGRARGRAAYVARWGRAFGQRSVRCDERSPSAAVDARPPRGCAGGP